MSDGIIARQELEYAAQRYGIIIMVIVCLLAFLSPLVMRIAIGAPITPGAQSYVELRHAELMLQGVMTYDPMHPASLVLTPYTCLLAFMELFGVPWLLSLLLAILFVILLYLYLIEHYHHRAIVVFAMVALVLSPTMSVLATEHHPALLCLIFVLLAFQYSRFSPFFIGLAALTSPILGLLCGVALLAYHIWQRRTVIAVLIGIALGCAITWHLAWRGVVAYEEIFLRNVTPQLFFEFGLPVGVSIFFLIIGIYGIVVGFTGRRIMIGLLLMALLLMTAAFPSITVVLVVALSILVGHAVHHLLTVSWRLLMLQESLLILIACIGIFLLITASRERIADMPSAELSHALITLRNQERVGAVLTAPEYAPLVEYYSGREAMFSAEDTERAAALFSSRNSDLTYRTMSDSDVAYVLITGSMRESIFASSDEGILFLLQHGGRFVQIFDADNVMMWYFIKQN
jgi:hypothetical protein